MNQAFSAFNVLHLSVADLLRTMYESLGSSSKRSPFPGFSSGKGNNGVSPVAVAAAKPEVVTVLLRSPPLLMMDTIDEVSLLIELFDSSDSDNSASVQKRPNKEKKISF